MMSSKKYKPVSSYRLDNELVKAAKAHDINLPALFEASIAKALKIDKCPYCGRRRK